MNSISTKFFLAILGLTILVLIASLGLARWSFNVGFDDYVSARERQHLESIAEDLIEHYQDNGDQWTQETKQAFRAYSRRRPEGRFGPHSRRDFSRPEDELDANQLGSEGQVGELKPPHRNGPPPRRRPLNISALYNSSGELIGGREPSARGDSILSVPLKLNGNIIGELRSRVPQRRLSSLESKFEKQQTMASFLIAILSLLFAAAASWFLARAFIAPILKMKRGVALFAEGNYEHKLTSDSSDELGELMDDISQLGETLQLSRVSRRQWLADISHELRTPVTILAGEIEAIQDGLRPLDQTQLASIAHEVDRLRSLINDLYELSLSDIGGLRYEFSELSLGVMLDEFVELHRRRVEDQGFVFNFTNDAEQNTNVSADLSRLKQLFSNLLNNSLAYTQAPGKIAIHLYQNGDNLIVKIMDTSPGVATEHIEQVFEPLFREEQSRSRRLAGAGLGLTICRNIVHAHQGSIVAMSSELGGLCIKITLPVVN